MDGVPVICIDGPSGAGKGTLAVRLARQLGWHLLDSGALYRLVGKACIDANIDWDDEGAVARIARSLDAEFDVVADEVVAKLGGADVTADIRSELGSKGASSV
ncbi:MAG: (d)CMP kinase, partial [Halieaceae bacterium]